MRRENSIRNISYSIIGQIVSNLLSFVSRTIFIATIGITYLGINGLFSVIFGLLSLANLGLDNAISYSLYEPIVKGDTNKINILMKLYAKAYKIIAGVIGVVGIALIPFLPYVIKDMPDIPYLRVYYLLTLATTVISYCLSYKRTLIICDQKAYINTKNSNLFLIIQICVQILLLIFTKKYALYLVTATTCTILSNISISLKVDKMYPYIKDKTIGKLDEKTKRVITKNVIAMMFNKISEVVVYSSDNLMLSTFIGIDLVGIYSNYYMIIQLIHRFLEQIFTAITASIANLYVVGSINEKQKAYHTIYFINFWIASLCTVCFYFLLEPFIILWIGEAFLLSKLTTRVLVILFYNQAMRYTVRAFKTTAGLYWNDRYRPLFEAIINLVFSIILIKLLGIAGVFIGTIVSLMTTSFWVEPYIIYKHILKEKFIKFLSTYFLYMVICLLQIAVVKFISLLFVEETVLNFICILFVCMIIPNVIIVVIFGNTNRFKNAIVYAKPMKDYLYKVMTSIKNIASSRYFMKNRDERRDRISEIIIQKDIKLYDYINFYDDIDIHSNKEMYKDRKTHKDSKTNNEIRRNKDINFDNDFNIENELWMDDSYFMIENNRRKIKYIGIVVVTYNNLAMLKMTLSLLKNQSFYQYKVYIIDNASTDETGDYLKTYIKQYRKFVYYKLKTNIGSSGGFHYGVKLAYKDGVDYIWGMDDTTFPHKNALEVLIRTIKKFDEQTCLVSNTTNSLDTKRLFEIINNENKLTPMKRFMFIGFFIPRKLIEDIGYPRKDLFVYFDDIDYSRKVINAGYKIYRVRDSLIQHQDMQQYYKKIKIHGKEFNVPIMSKQNWYYYMRNGIIVNSKKDKENATFRKYHLKTLIGVFYAFPDCFNAALDGYMDGKKGITGKSKKY